MYYHTDLEKQVEVVNEAPGECKRVPRYWPTRSLVIATWHLVIHRLRLGVL